MCCELVFGEFLLGHAFFLVEEDHQLEHLNHELALTYGIPELTAFRGWLAFLGLLDMEEFSWRWFWMDLVMKH
jgi:hypothetical protein